MVKMIDRLIANSEPDFASPARPGVADNTYHYLRDLVLSGGFPKGTMLQERRLAKELGVSRTPVREALARLESDGFAHRTGRGPLVVKGPAPREFIEILHLRQILEGEAAFVAAQNLSETDIEEITQQVYTLMGTLEPEAGEQVRIDDLIHNSIARASGNEHLAKLVADLRSRTNMFDLSRLPHRMQVGCREHLDLLTRLRERDGEGARQAMRQHLENVKQSIVNRLTQF
jgi:DNA-binding GntR family transcriptional regulator